MFRIPTTAPESYNSDNVAHLERIHVQYADATSVTKISDLDTSCARRKIENDKTSPLVFKVVPYSPSDYLTLQLDSLVHDTKDNAEVHTLATAFAFTLTPQSVYTIFGTCTSTKAAYYRNITVFTVPHAEFHNDHIALHFVAIPLHQINQLCIRNSTHKYITVKLMKTTSIDSYLKAPTTA